MRQSEIGAVVIGRNEGERLRACLRSLQDIETRVYVDSGSTDGSCALARSLGFLVVELTTPPRFSAARARNAGLRLLRKHDPSLEFVQMVDGDCEIRKGWFERAQEDLFAEPRRAVVFGRRRERHPSINAFHLACDDEWDVPTGRVNSCGGDALFRIAALTEVGDYNASLIAGEEPDLCLRLRQRDWQVWSNGQEMTWHDIAMNRLLQWWRRSQRTGFAIAELVSLHGECADPSWPRLLNSAVGWSAIIALGMFSIGLFLATRQGLLLGPAAILVAAPIFQIVRLALRKRSKTANLKDAFRVGGLIMIAKLAQTLGWLQFQVRRSTNSQQSIIEYKKE